VPVKTLPASPAVAIELVQHMQTQALLAVPRAEAVSSYRNLFLVGIAYPVPFGFFQRSCGRKRYSTAVHHTLSTRARSTCESRAKPHILSNGSAELLPKSATKRYGVANIAQLNLVVAK
jgi:hypothetical protein